MFNLQGLNYISKKHKHSSKIEKTPLIERLKLIELQSDNNKKITEIFSNYLIKKTQLIGGEYFNEDEVND